MIEVQAARGLQDSLARAAVQDPTTDRKQGTLFLPEWNLHVIDTSSLSFLAKSVQRLYFFPQIVHLTKYGDFIALCVIERNTL